MPEIFFGPWKRDACCDAVWWVKWGGGASLLTARLGQKRDGKENKGGEEKKKN